MGNYGLSGEVGETHRDSKLLRFEWKIHRSFPLPKVGFCYFSSSINFLGSPWYLRISPIGEEANEECIGVFLWRKADCSPKPVKFSIRMKSADGPELMIATGQSFPEGSKCNLIKSLRRSDLLNGQSYLSVKLIFICSMWIESIPKKVKKLVSSKTQTDDSFHNPDLNTMPVRKFTDETQKSVVKKLVSSTAQTDDCFHYPDHNKMPVQKFRDETQKTEGCAVLQKNLKDLLLRSLNHDITLKVKGKEFRAHKNILEARSPNLAAAFAPKSCKDKEIEIEDCDPETFHEFLLYVYTGQVENFTLTTAMRLYTTAMKYGITELKEQCVEHLTNSMTLSDISDVISFANEHNENELLGKTVAFFTDNLEEVLVTTEWQHFVAHQPKLANELYLKALTFYKKINAE